MSETRVKFGIRADRAGNAPTGPDTYRAKLKVVAKEVPPELVDPQFAHIVLDAAGALPGEILGMLRQCGNQLESKPHVIVNIGIPAELVEVLGIDPETFSVRKYFSGMFQDAVASVRAAEVPSTFFASIRKVVQDFCKGQPGSTPVSIKVKVGSLEQTFSSMAADVPQPKVKKTS